MVDSNPRTAAFAFAAILCLVAGIEIYENVVRGIHGGGATVVALVLVPAILTCALPRWWLLLWIPILAGLTAYLRTLPETTSDPGGLELLMVVGLFGLVNWTLVLGRLAFVLVDALDRASQGYIQRD